MSAAIPSHWRRHVPGCEADGQPLSVSPLGTGTAHQNWRVRTVVGEYVLRAPDPALPVMSQRDFNREHSLQQVASTQGIAPKIVRVDVQELLLVMEFIDGEAWSCEDFSVALRLRDLCARLIQLQHIEPPTLELFDPIRNAEVYAQQLLAQDAADSHLIDVRLAAARRLWSICCSDKRTAVILHCDLHAGNVLDRQGVLGADAIVQLDWEYAQIGDPLIDFAAICANYAKALPPVMDWLSHHAPGGARLAARLPLATAVFRLLSWLWYRVRALQQQPRGDELAQMSQLGEDLDSALLVRV